MHRWEENVGHFRTEVQCEQRDKRQNVSVGLGGGCGRLPWGTEDRSTSVTSCGCSGTGRLAAPDSSCTQTPRGWRVARASLVAIQNEAIPAPARAARLWTHTRGPRQGFSSCSCLKLLLILPCLTLVGLCWWQIQCLTAGFPSSPVHGTPSGSMCGWLHLA